MYRIYIPTGGKHIVAVTDDVVGEIQWNNTDYEDGHREVVAWLDNGNCYSIETVDDGDIIDSQTYNFIIDECKRSLEEAGY